MDREERTGRSAAALEQMQAQIQAFSDAVERAGTAMRARDAERFLRQYEWLQKRVHAALHEGGWTEDALLQALCDAAVECWRLERICEKAVMRMDLLHAQPFANRYSWFRSRMDDALMTAGIQTVDLTGEIYSVGMAVSALNADEFDDEQAKIVQMVDPIVMADGHVLRTGTVMLG